MTAHNYYTLSDSLDFEYCITPKALFRSEKLKKLSDGAKLLYIAILNRLTLSIKNGWQDESGNVFIYFSLEDVCDKLGCSSQKAVRLFKEIDTQNGAGLIERKRQGLGKPSVIYVVKPEAEKTKENDDKKTQNITYPHPVDSVENPDSEDVFFDQKSDIETPVDSKEEIGSYENDTSGLFKITNQDFTQSSANNNKINNNKLNNNYLNKHKINLSITSQNNAENQNSANISDGWSERVEKYKKMIDENLSCETLINSIGSAYFSPS